MCVTAMKRQSTVLQFKAVNYNWYTVWHMSPYLIHGIVCFWHAALRLCSAVHQHHPPQRGGVVLSQICCFREPKVVLFQIMLDGTEPCCAHGRPGCRLQFAAGGTNRILLASALSSMCIIWFMACSHIIIISEGTIWPLRETICTIRY